MKIDKKYLLEANVSGDVFDYAIDEEPNELNNLINKNKSKDDTNIDIAVLSDNIENVKNAIKKAIKKGEKITEKTFDYAILRENPIPEIVEIITKYLPAKTSMLLVKGLKTKKEDVVQAILKAGIKPDPNMRTLDYAIVTNNNNIVNLMLKNGDKPTVMSLYLAITMGNPDIVKNIINTGKVIPTSKDLEQAKKQKNPNKDIINLITNSLY